ncbi:MAG: isopeptide-forming domain-containing fimbrial protein [Collinsella sp.]
MSKNIARLTVTAGLTAALSFGGVMAPVTMAFAAGTDGSVTIKNVDGNATEFEGYQIFNADVADDGTVSNITWANTNVQHAVVSFIQAEDESYVGTTAQDAADWITKKVGDEGSSVAFNSTAYKIAAVVDGLADKKTTNNGAASGLAHGYWLFVTKADTINEGEAGTSPIFTVVGSTPVKVSEKTGIPTVEKKIVSDADSKEHDAADSQIGQDVTYNLYGTVAENFDKYDTYFYQFSDKISKGLTLQKGAKVYLYENRTDAKGDLARAKGTDITANFKEETPAEAAEDGSKTTTWTCDNLKTVSDVTKDSYIVVSYKAQINKDAVVAGTEGNENTVTLNYSNNPMTSTRGETQPDTVKDYTYGLKINKVDLGTEKALKDARFTITTKGDENSTNVKYVKEDGTLSGAEVVLSTDADGVIRLTHLDAGVYTVKEVTPPSGYTAVNPFTFEIKPTMTDDGPEAGLTELKGELTTDQGGKVIAGITDGNAGDNNLTAKPGSEKDEDGIFNITVGDTKQVDLPLTGLNGVTFTWIAGGAVLCIGVAHLIRSRKQAEESEQE